MKNLLLSFYVILLFVVLSFAQNNFPKAEIEEIIRTSKGTVGVGIQDLSNNKTFYFNKNAKLPMQSVFKFPLAMAVLDQVDKGKFSLEQKILITKKDVTPDYYSPIRDKYPEGNVELTLAEIIKYAVSNSDNVACDVLFRLIGGPANVQKYIRSLGVKDISVVYNEVDMQAVWGRQYENWCKPKAMLQLLKIVSEGKKLSKTSNDFLWKTMIETSTGQNRIKGLLPANISVAHKTGTGGTNDKGVTSAINDTGIIILPNGKKFSIFVFVSNSTDDSAKSEEIIAKIAKVSADYFRK
jgi:beta-lactamase class A